MDSFKCLPLWRRSWPDKAPRFRRTICNHKQLSLRIIGTHLPSELNQNSPRTSNYSYSCRGRMASWHLPAWSCLLESYLHPLSLTSLPPPPQHTHTQRDAHYLIRDTTAQVLDNANTLSMVLHIMWSLKRDAMALCECLICFSCLFRENRSLFGSHQEKYWMAEETQHKRK